MKNKLSAALTLAFCAILNLQLSTALAQGTAFTYQGRLNDDANPANGNYDLRFAIFDSVTFGAQLGDAVTNAATSVSNGLFTATLDFGKQFPGADRWLEIGVRTNGGDAFATLSPRQQITATPYAVRASSAASASSVAAANITGPISMAQLPSSVVTNGASGVNFMGTFNGNGAGITDVNVRILQRKSGLVSAWGNNSQGQTTVPTSLSNVVAVAGGDEHSLALKSDGTVVAWGRSSFGQTAIPMPAGLGNVVAIALGNAHSMALKSDGTVVVWGWNSYGQATIPAGLSNVVAIAGGHGHNLALKSDGTVVAWGEGFHGQATIPSGLGNVIAIDAGIYHSLALRSDGTVVAWGFNSDGQTTIPAGLNNVVAIAGGHGHNLALKSDGMVVAWGRNAEGQATIPPGLSNVVAIAAGDYHSMALKSDGIVVAWGNNGNGQTTIPVGLSNVVAIAGGGAHSLALRQLIPAQVAWKVTTVINTNLALPRTANFTSSGGTLIISASGSGYASSAQVIGMNIVLDGVVIDSCRINANQTLSHMAFVPKTIVRTGVMPGTHTLTLTALNAGTLTTDGIDYFCVTIQELPF